MGVHLSRIPGIPWTNACFRCDIDSTADDSCVLKMASGSTLPLESAGVQRRLSPVTTVFVHNAQGMTEETALDESPSNPHAPVPPPALNAATVVPMIPFTRALDVRDGVTDPRCCALSATGNSLHITGRGPSLWFANVGQPNETCIKGYEGVERFARSCALSPTGDIAALAAGHGLDVVRREGNKLLSLGLDSSLIAPLAPYSVAMSADASVVALSLLQETRKSGRVVVIDTTFCVVVSSWDIPLNHNQGRVALSAAGDVVAHAFTGGAQIVDAISGVVRRRWLANGSLDIGLDAAGEFMVIADERRLRIGHATSEALDVNISAYVPPFFDPYVAISADGGTVVASIRAQRIAIFCAKTGAMRAILTGQSAPATGLAMTGDGSVVMSWSVESDVHLWRINHKMRSAPGESHRENASGQNDDT